MTFRLGSTLINELRLGSTEVRRAYLGSTLIHDTTGGGGGSAPTFVAASADYIQSGASTLAWSAHQSNDIGLLLVLNRGSEAPITTPTGFTAATGSNSGVNSDDASLQLYWRRATSGAESDVSISDGSGAAQRTMAKLLVFRGCTTSGTPFVELGQDSASGSSAVSCPGGATGGDNRLIVAAMALVEIDQATSALTAGFTNGDLTNVTNRVEFNSDLNAGFGLYAATGERASSGTIGATTATISAATQWASASIALIPA